MRDLLLLVIHLLVIVAKLLRPGDTRAVAAESLLLKHQLLMINRSRQRAPNLTCLDRFVLGLTTLFVSRRRIAKVAAILSQATLFKFHNALINRKYRLLLVLDLYTRRIVGFGIDREHLDGVSVCRMFNDAVAGQCLPKRISTDHDPLFRFHRWLATLRVLEIEEVKAVPYVPVSHPYIERLIGTIRREFLDRTFFWNAIDLARKLEAFRNYYNEHRVHRALDGATPATRTGAPSPTRANLDRYTWRLHCNGLFQTPVAA